MLCIDYVQKAYTDAGWNVVRTKSDMTDLIASQDVKIHYVKIKSEYVDKDTVEGAMMNNFVQHALSGKAIPVYAETVTKLAKDSQELTVQKVTYYNPNTNARIIISRKKQNPSETDKKPAGK